MEIGRTALTIGFKFTEVKMGKVKAWLMDMEEDAMDMSREAWVAKHGMSCVRVWEDVRRLMELEQLEVGWAICQTSRNIGVSSTTQHKFRQG